MTRCWSSPPTMSCATPAAFRAAAVAGSAAAAAGYLVTFGVTPTHPATEYGYIGPESQMQGDALAVLRFAEKPDAAAAVAVFFPASCGTPEIFSSRRAH